MRCITLILMVLLAGGSHAARNSSGQHWPAIPEMPVASSEATDIDTIRQRVYSDFIQKIANSDIKNTTVYLASQNADGSWSDINYSDKGGSLWSPSDHLSRIQSFTNAYLCKGKLYYKDPALLKSIISGLNFWYAVAPTAPKNTWWTYIGKYISLRPIAILLQGSLPDTLMNKIINDFPSAMPKAFSTGANRADQDNIIITKALLLRDRDILKYATSDIATVIPITTREGIQRDFSFHQHGPMLYNVGYGAVFLGNLAHWMYMCRNTCFGFSQPDIAIVSDMLLEGNRWMTRGTVENYSATGRGITRVATADALGLTDIMYQLSCVADPVRRAKLAEMRASVLADRNQSISGNKHFWRSDFTAHHRSKYYTSVGMCSALTTGTEYMNGENSQGYWLGFGCNYLFRGGYEYKGIFPTWDWTHIPGVTNPVEVPSMTTYISQKETFVGGVSDSTYGVTAMKVNIQNMQARKSWFYFDNEYVALGSGISSTNANEVTTTVNQTFAKRDAAMGNTLITDTTITADKAKYVFNDSVAYIFPQKTNLTVSVLKRTGTWQSINSSQSPGEVTNPVFNLYVNHGVKPVDADYSYVVLPGVSQTDVKKYLKSKSAIILRNDTNVQAVCHKNLKLTGMVFYNAGTFKITKELSVSVSYPCIILLDQRNPMPRVNLASPDTSSKEILIKLISGKRLFEAAFITPSGDFQGSTMSKMLKEKLNKT